MHVIEKAGKIGRGGFFADVRPVCRAGDMRLCFAHRRFGFRLSGG